MGRYIIITPAHNEEAFIGKTLESITKQILRPVAWIIVNDGSTDGTAKIVESYKARYDFIDLINVERSGGRHFGNKVRAFNRGLEQARHFEYDFIGNLDADISLESHYFEVLISEFQKDPVLGLGGGIVASNIGEVFVKQKIAPDSVAGAVQLFRRACFEQIGGYVPLPLGGIDAAAEIMARMNHWNVRTFPDLCALEHRRTDSAKASPLEARIREGQRLYALGYDALFFFLRCIYRLKEPPRIIGSGAALLAFLHALLKREPLVLPQKVVHYLRAEQRGKLGHKLMRLGEPHVRN